MKKDLVHFSILGCYTRLELSHEMISDSFVSKNTSVHINNIIMMLFILNRVFHQELR